MLHSSGTTGPPKGVVLSHEAVLHLTRHLVWLMDYTADDRLFTTFPLFHNNAKYTSVTAAMECGGSLVMERKFSASGFWDTARAKGITAFNYMGALLMMMFKQPERPDDADNPIRIAFGAPCPVEIWEPFEERFGVRLVEVFGMTEAPMACENRLDDRRIGSAGKESMTYEVRDRRRRRPRRARPTSPARSSSARSTRGRCSPSTTRTRRRPSRPGATCGSTPATAGRMDADGFVYFIDRMKDCIRRRGENISSWEIESCINTHPDIVESAAYGVASELSESDVMVAVVRRPDSDLDAAAVLDHCQGRIAHFAVPRYVRFMDALPKQPRRAGAEDRAAHAPGSPTTHGTARPTATWWPDERADGDAASARERGGDGARGRSPREALTDAVRDRRRRCHGRDVRRLPRGLPDTT